MRFLLIRSLNPGLIVVLLFVQTRLGFVAEKEIRESETVSWLTHFTAAIKTAAEEIETVCPYA